jgi:2-dehydro-3-deoxygalactonokinase
MDNTARLIGVDWGSSSLRVFLFGGDGAILDSCNSPSGASQMQSPADFAKTLHDCAGHWMQGRDSAIPVLACGMVGSKHGWVEAPYLDTPTDCGVLGRSLRQIQDSKVYLVPGLIHRPENYPPDVMRGEETQIVGALHSLDSNDASVNDLCIVMPGTHSKWVRVQQQKVVEFATHMTGEMYSVMKHHSVLGRLLPTESGPEHRDAFVMALDAVRSQPQAGLTHQLFAVRTLGLTEKLSAQGLSDYLSGLLIAHEVQAGLTWSKNSDADGSPLVLIGEPALCSRYQLALDRFGVPVHKVLGNTAPAGLWRIASSAGLVRTH